MKIRSTYSDGLFVHRVVTMVVASLELEYGGCLCGVKTHSAAVCICHVVAQRRLSRPLPVKGMACRTV